MIAQVAASLEVTLAAIAEGSGPRDRAGQGAGFPAEPIERLRQAGALAASAALGTPRADEWTLVRRVAAADASVGRILDGHLNAVERLAVHAPDDVREAELAAVVAGERTLGVWGADPVDGEGAPARVDAAGTVTGTKVFCSGAGGLDRAVVLVRSGDAPGPPLAVYVDLTAGVEIDRGWFAGAGMRRSESHRVTFSGARVIARLGEPGALSAEPWFSRDALRTAASWTGIADALRASALEALAARAGSELVALAAARIDAAHATAALWMEEAGREADDEDAARVRARSLRVRAAIADASATMVREAAAAAGSRPFAVGGPLDRARRDLELLLLQKRLDPLLARHGAALLAEGGRG